MTQITPEEAQEKTEQAWRARTEDRVTPGPSTDCGWCEFADSICAEWCPVYRIIGKVCCRLPQYEQWHEASWPTGRQTTALGILEMLKENRKRLIAAAYEILEESDESNKS